jgi:hypothetical protein|tara:strand:+ start:145 stop:354 length:210 start_codon:yes stop_codon:yes gene_type:complete
VFEPPKIFSRIFNTVPNSQQTTSSLLIGRIVTREQAGKASEKLEKANAMWIASTIVVIEGISHRRTREP